MKRKIDGNKSSVVAVVLYNLGIKPRYSHDIGENLSCGYGKLDDYGFWQFPLYFIGE
jgi:hypothetical protein